MEQSEGVELQLVVPLPPPPPPLARYQDEADDNDGLEEDDYYTLQTSPTSTKATRCGIVNYRKLACLAISASAILMVGIGTTMFLKPSFLSASWQKNSNAAFSHVVGHAGEPIVKPGEAQAVWNGIVATQLNPENEDDVEPPIDDEEPTTNPEHVAASVPTNPYAGPIVEYECTTLGGCRVVDGIPNQCPAPGDDDDCDDGYEGDGWVKNKSSKAGKGCKASKVSKGAKSSKGGKNVPQSPSWDQDPFIIFHSKAAKGAKGGQENKLTGNEIQNKAGSTRKNVRRSLLENPGFYIPKEGEDVASVGWESDPKYEQDLEAVRLLVTQLIEESERELIPVFLRLGFHDCVGGICDGCVDMTDPDNRGLEEAIVGIYPAVEYFKDKYSRADLWAWATLVGTDLAAIEDRPDGLAFPLSFLGRVDCDNADPQGRGGPKVAMPPADLTTHKLFEFFKNDFDFDTRETVTIMGAHSVAIARRFNVGFGNIGREHGWVDNANSYVLNNRYYPSVKDPLWHQEFLNNEQFNDPAVPNRYQFYIDPQGETSIMLIADLALVSDMDGFVINDQNCVGGLVLCLFSPQSEFDFTDTDITGVKIDDVPLCPHAGRFTEDIVDEFENDNDAFLFSFSATLGKMVTNGYRR